MIQRIQTIFLLGAVIISITLFFVRFSEKQIADPVTDDHSMFILKAADIEQSLNGAAFVKVADNYPVLGVNILILAIAAALVFLYRNRPNQIRLCMFGGLMSMIQLVLVFYFTEKMGDPSVKAHYLEGIYLVGVQVIVFLAARYYIRKDEMLVRAADRIR